MDLHERQQFDFLLQVAVDRYVERLEQTGPERVKPWDFTNAIFSDFLLDNADGACFVLRALATQRPSQTHSGNVEETLISMAKDVFSHLLQRKVEESCAQRAGYGGQNHDSRN